MTSTIKRTGGSTITVLMVTDYEWERALGNSIEEVQGTSAVDVQYEPAGLRAGTLNVLVADLTAALALEALLVIAAGTYELADTDEPGVNMTFVVLDKTAAKLQKGTRRYILTVGFQEVS